VPWSKTDAGRLEIQSRSLVHGRPQRNLLLLIDGKKTEAQLLASVTGIAVTDLQMLRDLGLIVSSDQTSSTSNAAESVRSTVSPAPAVAPPAATPPPPPPTTHDAPTRRSAPAAPSPAPVDIPVDLPRSQPSFDHVSKTLTSLIASELGLRGFTLTLAVERASGIDALLEVANRALAQIEQRKGVVAADRARRALFG